MSSSETIDALKHQINLLEAEKAELSRQLLSRDATISCLQQKNGVLRRALASAKEQHTTSHTRRHSCFASLTHSALPWHPDSNAHLTDGELHHAAQLARQGRRAVKTLLDKLSKRDNPQQVGSNRAIVLHPDCSAYDAEVQRKAEHIRTLLAEHFQQAPLEVHAAPCFALPCRRMHERSMTCDKHGSRRKASASAPRNLKRAHVQIFPSEPVGYRMRVEFKIWHVGDRRPARPPARACTHSTSRER